MSVNLLMSVISASSLHIARSSDTLMHMSHSEDELEAPLAPGQQVFPRIACEFVLSGGCCDGCPRGDCYCDESEYHVS